MVATHTPGPWHDEITDEGDLYVRIPDHDIYIGDMEVTCGACHANARLIAAAPDLKTALEGLLEDIDHYAKSGVGPSTTALSNALAALAKATGEDR